MRALFTDGVNSATHFTLGVVGGKELLPWFLLYQFGLQGDQNAIVDSSEYLIGWLCRYLLASQSRSALSRSSLSASSH